MLSIRDTRWTKLILNNFILVLSYKFKFAIIASGFCSGSLVHKGFYDEEITLPTLHVFGETDKIIPKGNLIFIINLLLIYFY